MVILTTLSAIGFLLIIGKRHAALLVLASIGGGMLLSSGLKNLFERPRPDLVPHVVQVYTLSFPSGHAMLSAATYLTLGALLARVQPKRVVRLYLLGVAILLTLLIGASRVYLSVHCRPTYWPAGPPAPRGRCSAGQSRCGCSAAARWRRPLMRPDMTEVLTSGIAVILQEIDRISSLDSVMALNIKDARTDRLARELAQLTGQSITEAVAQALEAKLHTERRRRGSRSIAMR